MRKILITLTIVLTALFLFGCDSSNPDETAIIVPQPNDVAEDEMYAKIDGDYARDNLDLNAVGALLEQSDSAENFEYLLNSDNRVNNLDLNGDGYVDYISVAEYEDRDSNQRGFTLFDRFGADDVQEIARIFFDRDRSDNRGARILLTGNEQLYGDDYYYEANWMEKSLQIVNWAFGDRAENYQSTYYYDNYPNNYNTYRVVETPVYRTRIQQYYPQPVFIRTKNPVITQIKIKSNYKNRSFNSVFAKLAKPSKEQKEFRKSNPKKPDFVTKDDREDRSAKPEKMRTNNKKDDDSYQRSEDRVQSPVKNDQRSKVNVQRPEKSVNKVNKSDGRGKQNDDAKQNRKPNKPNEKSKKKGKG